MAGLIRQATVTDAPQWLALLKDVAGEEYPDPRVYQMDWVLAQFGPASEIETWVVELNGRIQGSISLLKPRYSNPNPVANIGRHLVRPESFADGSAGELLKKVHEIVQERKQHIVSRVLAIDHSMQILYEKLGYRCAGFQPFKHMNRVRHGTLFYVRLATTDVAPRAPFSESLPQIRELAASVLSKFNIPQAVAARDGAIGHPLQSELEIVEASFEEFDRYRQEIDPKQVEMSGDFNLGSGWLRTTADRSLRAMLAKRDQTVTAGLAYYFDPFDRCLRLTHSFCSDGLSLGALLSEAVKIGQQQLSAVYAEVDILITAPRLLKTVEQLGFVPIAYLPEFYFQRNACSDVVKLVKLNILYSPEPSALTTDARGIAEIVDRNFKDQKVGVAIVNLLRGLPIFHGLGDGELRKIARLFTQRLFLPGERIFNKGDSGKEAYVIVRGAVEILLDETSPPIARVDRGQILGELAFLDGAARVAIAVAAKPTILLIVQRTAFAHLVQQEPHLGIVVMRNIAIELTNRLRKTNAAVVGMTK